ncbi:MAG: hypothetical protein K0S01_1972 [Herbinix sp.]|jgi:hypothetical protein|nr:hypothetical protein [Herbinix sp.]
MLSISIFDLDSFYPSNTLVITQAEVGEKGITIRMKSNANSCECPNCQYQLFIMATMLGRSMTFPNL